MSDTYSLPRSLYDEISFQACLHIYHMSSTITWIKKHLCGSDISAYSSVPKTVYQFDAKNTRLQLFVMKKFACLQEGQIV
jgi:hypothetical protein